jgi:hypothetical protein
MADGIRRRIFINGKEYGAGGGSGGTVTVSDTALVEFVITAADPANTPLLVHTVIVMTDEHGNVTTLVLGGREIRVVKGTYQIDVACEDVGDWNDTRAITADEVIEIALGMSMLDGRWGYPRSVGEFDAVWSNPAWIRVAATDAELAANFDFFSRSVDEFDSIWSNPAFERVAAMPNGANFDGYSRTANEFDSIWSNPAFERVAALPNGGNFDGYSRTVGEFDAVWSNSAVVTLP